MIFQSNGMFSEVIDFYSKKLEKLLGKTSVPIKKDIKMRISEQIMWFGILMLIIQMSILRGANRSNNQSRMVNNLFETSE